jgi:hypothetical protein
VAVHGAEAGLAEAVGAVVVLAVVEDVFFTVLFPGSGHGVLRRPVTRWTWKAFRAAASRLSGPRRRAFLTYSGPTQITVNLGAWIVLMVAGWALIFWPALGAGIAASSGSIDRSWVTAVYYSAYLLTTLGLGDVVPRGGTYRLLTVLEAGIGFATVSMAITYFLSVYSALTERKISAALLHHRTYDTGDAANLLAGLADGGNLPGAADELMSMAAFVQRALETHAAYPVLRYFHQRRTFYALPRVLLLSFDTVSLLQSALDERRYKQLIASPAVAALNAASRQLLDELVPEVEGRPPSPADQEEWRQRFTRAAERFRDAGLDLRADPAAAATEYLQARAHWDHPLRTLANAMVYDWQQIEPPPAEGAARSSSDARL